MRQPNLGAALSSITYLTIPVVLDGSSVTVDLTDDGEPGTWGNTWQIDKGEGQEGGYWRPATSEEYDAAWGLVAPLLEGAKDGN